MTLLRVVRKFGSILEKKEKQNALGLGIMMVIAGFMEMLSVSLLLPFVEAVLEPERIMSNATVYDLCQIFNINSKKEFLISLSVIMALLYLIKNVFLLFQIRLQNKFVYQTLFSTQQRLLKSFINRPYESFLQIQSGEVLRIIGTDTVSAFGILTHILNCVTELIVSLTLIITVLVIAPGIILGVGIILIVLIVVIQLVTRPILKKAGHNHQLALSGMNKWTLQSVQGIKELKLMKCESFFQENFNKEGEIFVTSTYKQMTYNAIPKYLIEAITMGSFFVFVAIMFVQGADVSTLVPILTSIAMAAIRLLPAASRISGSLAGISFGEPAVDKLIENLKESSESDKDYIKAFDVVNKSSHEAGEFIEDIEMVDVQYKYPTGEHYILQNASMRIDKGMSVGIVGASGAGKTTAVDLILGLLKPQCGSVLMDGISIHEQYEKWLNNIGYVPQNIFLLDATIRENVAFGVSKDMIDDERVWKALKEASLDEYVKGLPNQLSTEIGERGIRISGGQRQRLGIARALYFNPQIIFFDEATSALDNETERAIMESINHLQGSKTLIIIAHRLTTIENCDKIFCVESGKINEIDKKSLLTMDGKEQERL